jgi:hypothetical protein
MLCAYQDLTFVYPKLKVQSLFLLDETRYIYTPKRETMLVA